MKFNEKVSVLLVFLLIQSMAFALEDKPLITESRPKSPVKTEKKEEPNASMHWRGDGGWGMGCGYCQDFDLTNKTTVTGIVEKVETMLPGHGMMQGVQLSLKTEKETIAIHLGPKWYLENQGTSIVAKDKISIKGVKTTWNGKPTIIAFEIEKDGKTLVLRNEQGAPGWSGWHEGHMMHGTM
jgi:hypothetical protein